MSNENQKKTTDEYRSNWDNIFKKKEIHDTKLKEDKNLNQNNTLEPVLGGVVQTIVGGK